MIPGITLPSDYLRLALRVVPWALLAVAVAWLLITRSMLAQEKAGRLADRAAYTAAQEKARADDLAHARAVEAQQTRIQQEATRDLEDKLAAARADADAYARRLRDDQAAQGGVGGAHLPFTPATAVAASGAGEAAVVDDLRICAANTVIAEGWQQWWRRIEGVER